MPPVTTQSAVDPKDILLIGVKGTVIACRRDTGTKLWSTRLKSGEFVTVVADDLLVYAHTNGELSERSDVAMYRDRIPRKPLISMSDPLCMLRSR